MGATTWTDEDRAHHVSRDDRAAKVIEHLDRHGALEEASRVIDRILDGTEASEVISHDEALARMDRYC